MAFQFTVSLDGINLAGELFDTPAARSLAAGLPLELTLNRWGEEYYGSLGGPLQGASNPTQEVMSVGDIAHWEPGTAFCIFFGPTPMSGGNEPVAAGPVHLLGNVSGDWNQISAMGSTVQASLRKS
jgi:hypothetical protein